ncbi:MAG: flagellar basal body rod protein FlgC [Clostridia bacterium]|nr:flagellar basal body rod protein FlgC [Clostridia bacterium]
MAFLDSFSIAGSGLTAEKTRMNIIAENIANIDTTRTEAGGPYTRKLTVFRERGANTRFSSVLEARMARVGGLVIGTGNNEGAGVEVDEIIDDRSEYKLVYDPENPDANEMGYVEYPNVDLIKETTDAMAATRAYQANITALNSIRMMAQNALEIGQ